MASLVSDFCRFICGVVSRWQAYLTGGLLMAVGFVYEHLARKMIPGNVVLWGATAFFVIGAFMAWRGEYRSNRPIEIRDRLDAYLQRGQMLLDLWMNKRRPKTRTNSWNRRVLRFVKKHFDIDDYDYMRSNILSDNKLEIEVALKLAPSWGKSQGFDTAQLLETRLEVLKQLRRKICDQRSSITSL